jgi:hypothetical protein
MFSDNKGFAKIKAKDCLTATEMQTLLNIRLGRATSSLFRMTHGHAEISSFDDIATCGKCTPQGLTGAGAAPFRLDPHGLHTVNCKLIGQRSSSHKHTCLKLASLFTRAGMSPHREVLPSFRNAEDGDMALDVVCENVPQSLLFELFPDFAGGPETGTIMVDFTCNNVLSRYMNGAIGMPPVGDDDLTRFFKVSEAEKREKYGPMVDRYNAQGNRTFLIVAATTFHGRPSPAFDNLIRVLSRVIAQRNAPAVVAANLDTTASNTSALELKAAKYIRDDFYMSFHKGSMTSLIDTATRQAHLRTPRHQQQHQHQHHNARTDHTVPTLDAFFG